MTSTKKLNSLIISSLFASQLSAQEVPGKFNFIHPMDIPLELSGNFMEPRNDHFHSGLDMRTESREGIPVKAVADGWISRIKISPFGYGKAVYIDHANGLTSVYGHLKELQGATGEACLDAQYKAKDFSIDIYPEKNAVPVAQGDVIGLSGNTGGSRGPHLHFEIRRSADQHALDPEAFGYELKDNTPPEIKGIRIYALNDTSCTAPYPATAKGFAVQGGAGRYSLKPGDVPTGYGTVGLAIHTLDRYDNSSNKFGVRKIEMFVDSVPAFSAHFNEVNFDHNRYCNAHMDHALFKNNSMEYHRCYKLPNNKLRIYGNEKAQGRIVLEPGKERHVRFVVTDANGNTSQLEFMLKGAPASEAFSWPTPKIEGSFFPYDRENLLVEEGVELKLPALALYDDAYVKYERRKAPPKAIAPLHVLHDPLTPIQLHSQLSIAVPDLADSLRNKALIVRLDNAGKPMAAGGRFENGSIMTQTRSFGNYTVMIDTIPPTIRNVDLKADMKGRSEFNIKVQDDLSGVSTWKATIDGQWILMDYEPKLNLLTHKFDRNSTFTGTKNFAIEVSDDRGNTSNWTIDITR